MQKLVDFLRPAADWLINEPAFSWFDGSGFTFVFCCAIFAGCIACVFSKKLRSKFF